MKGRFVAIGVLACLQAGCASKPFPIAHAASASATGSQSVAAPPVTPSSPITSASPPAPTAPPTEDPPGLPRADIQRVFRANFSAFGRCYEAGLAEDETLAGKVVPRFVIRRDGSVSHVEDDGSTLPNASVVRCILEEVAKLQFPKPSQPLSTTYPLEFKPEPQEAAEAPRSKIRDLLPMKSGPCEALRDEALGSEETFALVFSGESETWRRFTSFAEYRAALGENDAVYESAQMAQRAGFRLVATFHTTPSGDWVQFIDYCYRPDGTLAELHERYNRGSLDCDVPITRESRRRFSVKGWPLSSETEVRTLTTFEKTRCDFLEGSVPAHTRFEQQPFFHLVPRN